MAIKIGEWVQPPGLRNGIVCDVDLVTGPAATGCGRNDNQCGGSYVFWKDFAKATGLDSLFYDREVGLLRDHPGIVRLDVHHAGAVRSAIAVYMKKHPGAVPEWCGKHGDMGQPHWFLFWIEWALADCSVPAIANADST